MVLECSKLADLNPVRPGLGLTGLSGCLVTQHDYTYSVRLVKLLAVPMGWLNKILG
jgi:hypothetical protein